MKIKRLVIQNVMSYRQRTEFVFESGLNILIGTNGGGKTNLQRIIALTLTKYFIYQYQFSSNEQPIPSIVQTDPLTDRALARAFPTYFDDASEQIIEIEFTPETTDVANIRAIGGHLDELNDELAYWERSYDTYEPLLFADDVAKAPSFTYVVRNLALEEPTRNTAPWAFLVYLRTFFVFVRVAHRIPHLSLNAPVFFFASDRPLNRNVEVQTGQLTEQSYFDGFRSVYQAATGGSINLMQWASQHFVRIYRRAVIEASSSTQIWQHYFDANPDVELLTRYMGQLGYKWEFLTDNDQLSYRFLLLKDDTRLSPEMFSSGEREVVHFLLAMFALNVRGGLVLVDEPELHLHPRWQRILLGLFRDLAPERDCQFLITTHSPVFVTPETINSITRVFRTIEGGSARVALKEVQLPDKRSLVRMINSQNNERLFFADKVVLVEGISDRLVFSSLLESTALLFRNSLAVEIIEVGGKGSFANYHTVLRGLQTPAFIVADLDYLLNVGSESTTQLFEADSEKQLRILSTDKKSSDRANMIERLDSAIRKGETDELRRFWTYFRARVKKLKSALNEAETALVAEELQALRSRNTFVLRYGEIEDYLPPGARDLKGIVDFLADRNWINHVLDENHRLELGSIACSILDLAADQRSGLMRQLQSATVMFPEPLAVPHTEQGQA